MFLLRIEDTDEDRNREEWVAGILEAMAWLGMEPDEPYVRQTDFEDAHRAAADRLLATGHLYGCDCTREAIDARLKGTGHTGYDGHCRDRGLGRGPGVALRFKVPADGVTVVHDLVRGDVAFPNDALDDFVVERSNGKALFALANLVDDRAMQITHVVRAEEHLANTPKQLLLAAALDEGVADPPPTPAFAHLPLLVNEQRQKISKRRDPVAVELYRDRGIVADAMVNFLALLGWSPRDSAEVVSRQVLIDQFALEDVNHSPAYFDLAKLSHLNGLYLRAMAPETFVAACLPFVDPGDGWTPSRQPPWPKDRFDAARFDRIAPLVQERVAELSEVVDMVDFLFLEEAPIDERAFDSAIRQKPEAIEILREAHDAFAESEFTAEALHQELQAIGERHGLALRKAQAPVRVAVTGRSVGPPLFESLAILGRDEVRRRLARSIELAS